MFRSTPLLLLLSVLLCWSSMTTVSAQSGDVNCPTFECFNGSQCADSEPDMSAHPLGPDGQPLDMHREISRDGKHCACTPNWTGLRCGTEYESCFLAFTKEQNCYNGGKCVPGLQDIYGNEQYYCDCTNAKNDDGVEFVGKYCEKAGIHKCDPEGKAFCVNGRDCKPDFADHPLEPCDCGNDLVGPHCEFHKGTVPDCDMSCLNGGICRLGFKNLQLAERGYDDFWGNPDHTQFCECPEGFSGTHCHIKAVECGDKHCFHGGVCVSVDSDGGPMCDCTSAANDQHFFAGKYCQYESTVTCPETPNSDAPKFCVNGGTCKQLGSHLGCNCPAGYDGPLCEYFTPTETIPTCSLQCQNRGTCRKGVKDFGTLKDFDPSLSSIIQNNHTADFEHCICPDGYTGLTCEIELDMCPNGEHVCLHGSECQRKGGEHTCACDTAFTMFNRFAGKHCEHPSTSICTANGEPGVGRDEDAFCVNSGVCRGDANGNGHPGCDCPTDFAGEHCEFSTAPVEATTGSGGGGKGSTGVVIFAVVFAAVIVVIVGAMMYHRRYVHGKEMDTLDIKQTGTGSSEDGSTVMDSPKEGGAPVLDMGPEKDNEGNELQNVEII